MRIALNLNFLLAWTELSLYNDQSNCLSGDADDSVYSVLCTQHEALLSHLYKASLKYDSEGTLLVKHLSSLLQGKCWYSAGKISAYN